jgi:hypothetical protein
VNDDSRPPCQSCLLTTDGRFFFQRLGHAAVSITRDAHSHAVPALLEEAAALIAGLVLAER